MADKAASVLAKLRNKAKASGISYQQCLQLFVQEEFLRKLSKSGYGDTLILKGGLFIYTLTNFESRATIDVDFLLRGYPNSIEDIKEASNPVPTPLSGHRCRSSQEITGSPTPFSTSNHYLWICPRASFSLSNPNIAA